MNVRVIRGAVTRATVYVAVARYARFRIIRGNPVRSVIINLTLLAIDSSRMFLKQIILQGTLAQMLETLYASQSVLCLVASKFKY